MSSKTENKGFFNGKTLNLKLKKKKRKKRERPWRRCFPMNFAKFLKTPFFTEHLRWQLLNLVNDYLSSRKQRTKMVSSYTDCIGISWSISLGFSLGWYLFFDICRNDILLCIEKSSISNFADDSTLFSTIMSQ